MQFSIVCLPLPVYIVCTMYYIQETRRGTLPSSYIVELCWVVHCAVQCSVPLQTTNYRVHLTSFQETRRGPPVLLHCRVESLYNVHVLSKKSVEYPYILKAKKLADSAFSVQNNWRKKCVYLDDSICVKNAWIMNVLRIFWQKGISLVKYDVKVHFIQDSANAEYNSVENGRNGYTHRAHLVVSAFSAYFLAENAK